MALTFKEIVDELPQEDVKIVCKYKDETGNFVYGEFLMQKCHSNDSPFGYFYNFYFAHKTSQVAGVSFDKVTEWAEWEAGWTPPSGQD